MEHKGFRHWRNTITGRIIIGFLVSTLIPTIIIVTLLCLQFEQNFRTTAKEQMKISGSLVADLLDRQFDNINTITMAPYYNSYFSSRIAMNASDPDYQSEYLAFQDEMQQLFNLTTYSSSDIMDLAIWSDGLALYHILYDEDWCPSMLQNITEQPWYSYTLELKGKLAFTPAVNAASIQKDTLLDTSFFFITRQIRNIYNLDQTNLVILTLSTNTLDAQLKNLNLLYNSFVSITNERGELIYSSLPLTSEMLQQILTKTEFHADGSSWYGESFQLKNYDLTVHVAHCLDELHWQIFSIVCSAAALYLAGLFVAYLLFRRYNRWITASIQPLLDTFSRIEDGDLETHCANLPVEEFNHLSVSVNQMIDQLNERIRREYLMTIQQKSLQLYALQSQIQPHFLNNTLYCFIALNQLGERSTLNSALYSLSHLLRYVLSKEQYTSLGQECAFLEDYLKLQKLRFADRLSYKITCTDDLRSIRVPRLLLQPLLENAIIHGIEPSESPCYCHLICEKKQNNLMLTIADNGVGFCQDEFEQKLKEAIAITATPNSAAFRASTREKTSIGIYYVQERLKMWSDKATLQIRRDGELTVAEIAIPLEEISYETSDC